MSHRSPVARASTISLKAPKPLLRLAAAGIGFAVVSVFGAKDAFAQQAGKVITIGEVTIVGRVQKPIASVDVSKIQPKLTLAELRQPFVDRIEAATLKEPF